MIKTISAKDLRAKFPWVQSQLQEGIHFIVICRSKPIAELKPLSGTVTSGNLGEKDEMKVWLSLTEKSLGFWDHPSNDAYAKLLKRKV